MRRDKLGSMRNVVTGEAVELELPAETLITRGAALLVDLIVYWAALVLSIFLLGTGTTFVAPDPALQAAMMLGTVVLFLVVAPITVETLSRGRSLGRLIFGIRIVRDDGGSIRLRHAVIRGLVGFGEVYLSFGLVPLLCSMLNSRGKRLGDMVAGTYAVQARRPAFRPMMLPVPQHLTSWTQIADVGRLPDGLAAQVTQLLRAVENGGASRNMPVLHQTAERLAAEVAPYVSPAPPPSPALDFLTAVMAERRNRDYRRMRHRQERQHAMSMRLHTVPYR